MQRPSRSLAVAVALVGLEVSVAAARVVDPPKPNLIFILADDLGYGDLGCYGQRQVRTPRLDQMAREGTRFTQVYAGSTVCAPSRCVLMTGRHTGHARIRGNARHALQPEDVTVAEVLRDAGYDTALIGKWGLGEAGSTGHPNRQGFDFFFGYLNQVHAHNHFPHYLWRNEEKVLLRNVVPAPTAEDGGVATERHEYSTDLFTAEALRWIAARGGRPFFLYLSYTVPHANNEAKEKGMEVPDLGTYAGRDWPEPNRGHAAMITRLDRDVGRLLDRLRELGLEGDTLVLFSSDNGPHREGGFDPALNASSGPWRGIKRDLYEGGIRVPMIAWGPGRVPAGRVDGTVWWFADFLPAAAALAGAAVPPGLDGVNVAPLLLGQTFTAPDRALYWEFHEGGFAQALRWRDWKAVRPATEILELYDLARDPGETDNLATARPELAAALQDRLRAARTDSEWWPVQPDAPQ